MSFSRRLLHGLLYSPSAWFAVLWIFLVVPQVDFAVSRTFFDGGRSFGWARGGILEFVRSTIPDIIIGTLALSVILWLVGTLSARWLWRITPPQIVYLAATLLIGPGLIVESILKPHWGRARPREIAEFGGTLRYSPPWQISDQCDSNCSFVSGHAAIAFWLTAYAFILPPKWRALGICLGILAGFAMGFVRIAQGAHFVSDIATAGLIVLLVNELLARVILSRSAESALGHESASAS